MSGKNAKRKRRKLTRIATPICPWCGETFFGDIGNRKNGYCDELSGEMMATCEEANCQKTFYANYYTYQFWDVARSIPKKRVAGRNAEEKARLIQDLSLRENDNR